MAKEKRKAATPFGEAVDPRYLGNGCKQKGRVGGQPGKIPFIRFPGGSKSSEGRTLTREEAQALGYKVSKNYRGPKTPGLDD